MFKQRLKNLRKLKGLSQDELAKKINKKYSTKLSKSMISRWENGADPQLSYVRILADYFGIDYQMLISENETFEDISMSNSLNKKIMTPNSLKTELKHSYNFFDAGLSAGILTEVDPFTKDDAEQITLSDVVLGKYAGEQDIFISYINGESMNRIIPNGSLIAVKKYESFFDLKDGDIVVFQDDSEMAVKRFYNDKTNGIVTFSPDSNDPCFKPINYLYSNMNEVKIIGKVVVYTVEI
ncbi:XRE family transcriptional regulator [Pediococcus acidilactici]|uniref:XRE family transcriptional regulator n=1 Tax=Pediococcus acidilactici TaxID=1254 RepID=UPI0020CC9327|nr:LexA family transcriptional regulator [Pediococcus acidilactici]MCQ0055467.1 XRE family transcriptional regulator [Pediococcus acidilactici]MCQ0078110.1 XRE family transcriptional regulator [Pediococcus acidilactici]